jgi:uncharacterized repeat protein (TIGR03847 family)
MAGRTFLFDRPERFVAGALGQPGQRTFFLQATKGSAVLSVAVEKVQVALLATRIGELLDTLQRRATEAQVAEAHAEVAEPRATEEARATPGPGGLSPHSANGLTEPVVEAFRVGSMTITYDDERHDLTLEAREMGEDDSDDDEPHDGDLDPVGHVMRVRLGLKEARSFAEDAMVVLAAGRPPCPICGEPLDPQGHICLRRNGYVM